jgi:copper chaperone CopZ
MSLQFKITNLTCSACIKLSVMALEKISGVTKATVDLTTGLADLSSEREVAWDEIVNALHSVGKEAINLN